MCPQRALHFPGNGICDTNRKIWIDGDGYVAVYLVSAPASTRTAHRLYAGNMARGMGNIIQDLRLDAVDQPLPDCSGGIFDDE